MSGAVARLLEQPELGHALAIKAKQVALSRFHPAAIARRHIEIYREILGHA
jgi:hypothetical protein